MKSFQKLFMKRIIMNKLQTLLKVQRVWMIRIIKINISIIKDTMLSYCFKCRRNTESINPKVSKTTNGKAIILSTCAICDSKESKFIKQQEAKGLLSNLGLRTPLNKIPVLGDILF